MKITESVLSPKNSMLLSERAIKSVRQETRLVPQNNTLQRTSTLGNVLEGTMNFVRKNVLSFNSLLMFAGLTCMVAVVLAIWAIYMFREQKAKMRNLQNMVVDMSLSEAKQRNGGVANSAAPVRNPSTRIPVTVAPSRPIVEEPITIPRFSAPIVGPSENEQLMELRRVQEEVSKLLSNPIEMVFEKTQPTVRVEDITNLQAISKAEIGSMVTETTDQKRRFENILNSFAIQTKEEPKIQTPDVEEDDDDFLKDIQLYEERETELRHEAENLEHDLQLAVA